MKKRCSVSCIVYQSRLFVNNEGNKGIKNCVNVVLIISCVKKCGLILGNLVPDDLKRVLLHCTRQPVYFEASTN